MIHCAGFPPSWCTDHTRKIRNVWPMCFTVPFSIECISGQNRFCGRELFLSKLCNGCSPQNHPCLLQLTVLPLPLFSFLRLLRAVFLPFLVPWIHNPVSFCMHHPALVIYPIRALTLLPSSSLSVLALHCLASILSLSFSFPSRVSLYVVGVKCLFNTKSICALTFFVPQ